MTDTVETTTDTTTAVIADPASTSADPAVTGVTTVVAAPAADAVERPADLPETFWDAEAKAPKYGDIATRLARADELEAADTARKDGVPADAKDYKFEPSGEPILGVDGQPAAIDPANPLVPAIAAVVHQHGLPQGVVSDLTRAFVETQVAEEKAFTEAMVAEGAKLGEKAKDRIDSVQAFIKQHCGEHADAAIASLGTAASVQAWEAMITKLNGATITAPLDPGKAKSPAESFYPNMTKAA